MLLTPVVLSRAFAVRFVECGWPWSRSATVDSPSQRTRGSLLISIVDSSDQCSDLGYATWATGHWVDPLSAAVSASGIERTVSLHFSDITPEQSHAEGTVLFTTDHAKQIISALNEHKGGPIFVHCAAGISRSGAVGEFIQRYFNLDYGLFKKTNPYIKPNPHVLHTLLDVSGMRDAYLNNLNDIFSASDI